MSDGKKTGVASPKYDNPDQSEETFQVSSSNTLAGQISNETYAKLGDDDAGETGEEGPDDDYPEEKWAENYENDNVTPVGGPEVGIQNTRSSESRWHNFESQYSVAVKASSVIPRDTWSSSIEFLLSCIASAVGLGNVWRFPFIAGKNGGGAFLIPYFLVVVFIGRPLFFLELCWGQFCSGGPVKAWEMAPIFKGVAFAQTIVSFLTSTYYMMIMTWTLLYFAYSFKPDLPWKGNTQGFFVNEILAVPAGNTSQYEAGTGLGPGPPSYKLVSGLIASWFIVWLVMIRGVSGSGKAAYFTALFPYVILLALLIAGCLLPGAGQGILYFLTPQWDKLLVGQTYYQAVSQCFFSLGISFGGATMFSSFNVFKHKLPKDVLIVNIMDTFTSMLAGIIIFAIFGNLALSKEELNNAIPSNNRTTFEKEMEKLAQEGAAVAFISYPAALESFGDYPVPNIFAALFFFMILTLAIGSANGLVGTVVTIICDAKPKWKRKYVLTGVVLSSFVAGLLYTNPSGSNMIDLVDMQGPEFCVFVLAFFEIIGVAWVYGLKNFVLDLEFMLDVKLSWYWPVCWGIIMPFSLVAIFAFFLATLKAPKDAPLIAIICGWILSGLVLIVPFIVGIYTIWTRKSRFIRKKLLASIYPTRKWGPKDPVLREAWRRYRHGTTHEYYITTLIKYYLCLGPAPVKQQSKIETVVVDQYGDQGAVDGQVEISGPITPKLRTPTDQSKSPSQAGSPTEGELQAQE